MAETATVVSTQQGVTSSGRRYVEKTVTFSGGGTYTTTNLAIGLNIGRAYPEIWMRLSSDNDGVAITTNDGTDVVLTAAGAITTAHIRFIGGQARTVEYSL